MSLDLEETMTIDSRTDSVMRTARGLGKLRQLLEKECEAQVGTRCAVHPPWGLAVCAALKLQACL